MHRTSGPGTALATVRRLSPPRLCRARAAPGPAAGDVLVVAYGMYSSRDLSKGSISLLRIRSAHVISIVCVVYSQLVEALSSDDFFDG